MAIKLPVHRIIPFSNVEGIGNRTSIFVQGCNLNCLYCHNSETIPMTSNDTMYYSVEELVLKIKENMPFIRGITVSGGEPTIYNKFLTELFIEVRKLGLTCYIDSNGFFDYKECSDLIEVTDKFLYDIKGLGKSLEKLCFSDSLIDKQNSGSINSKQYIKEKTNLINLRSLLSLNKVEEVRLVYIKDYYEEEVVIDNIAKELKGHPEVALKIIRVHAKGLPKERMQMLKGHIPSKLEVENLKNLAYLKGIHQINYIL